MPSSSFILVTLRRPKPPKKQAAIPVISGVTKKDWIVSVGAETSPPLLCSCMPSVAPYAKRAAKGADRQAQWMPICRCRSCPLMHIKPTPPARRTSHPAFLVPGILINRADRKPLSGPRRWILRLLSSLLWAAEMGMHVDIAFLQCPRPPLRKMGSGRERAENGDEPEEK